MTNFQESPTRLLTIDLCTFKECTDSIIYVYDFPYLAWDFKYVCLDSCTASSKGIIYIKDSRDVTKANINYLNSNECKSTNNNPFYLGFYQESQTIKKELNNCNFTQNELANPSSTQCIFTFKYTTQINYCSFV